jgi:hypothetical protein
MRFYFWSAIFFLLILPVALLSWVTLSAAEKMNDAR